MSEFCSPPYEELLQLSINTLSVYVENKVAPILRSESGGRSGLIVAADGAINLSLGFMDRVIDGRIVTIPTIFNIQLGPKINSGHGSTIVNLWEQSLPSFEVFGADSVTNLKFWTRMGYKPFDGSFWLKRKVSEYRI